MPMCSCTSTDRRAPFLDFYFFVKQTRSQHVFAIVVVCMEGTLGGRHLPALQLIIWSALATAPHRLVISGIQDGFSVCFVCLSDCPSVFVCFSVVEPCTSVQLPTLLLLCISERRVREREREIERKKEELIGQQYSHFALCVPVLYVRDRALTRFRKTASFVVVHKEKKWPRTQCKT